MTSYLITTLFLEVSTTNNTVLIDGVTQNIQNIQNPGTTTKTGSLQFEQIVQFIQTTSLYAYTGSLTTPPCSPGLKFHLASQPLPVSVDNYLKIKAVIGYNSRDLQNEPGQQNLLSIAANDFKTISKASGASRASLIPVPLSLLSFVLGYLWL
jgi:carbonic anhydrase